MYRPAYIKLSEALKRVMQSGLSEDDAKREILQAVGDQAVGILTERTGFTFRTFNVADLIQGNLSRGVNVSRVVDWENSRSDDLELALIELKRADVERERPKIPAFQPWSDADLAEYLQSPTLPMASLAEVTYVPPFVRLMLQAVTVHGLDGEQFVKKEVLADWFKGKQVNGSAPISPRQAEVMATLIREPSLMTGGNRRIGGRDD